jgi:hypothetical protein
MATLKAYRITCAWLPDVITIVAGASAGQARYRLFLDASDVYRAVRFQDFTVHRSPEYDDAARSRARSWQLGWRNTRTGEAAGVCERPA